jgi:hypothetical protein
VEAIAGGGVGAVACTGALFGGDFLRLRNCMVGGSCCELAHLYRGWGLREVGGGVVQADGRVFIISYRGS